MPFDYLRELAKRPLPQSVSDADEVDKLRVLKAAGCVEARIPESDDLPAVVLAITAKGKESLTTSDIS